MKTFKHKIYASNKWLANEISENGFHSDIKNMLKLQSVVVSFLKISKVYIHVVYATEFATSLKNEGYTRDTLNQIYLLLKKYDAIKKTEDETKSINIDSIKSQLLKYKMNSIAEAKLLIKEALVVKKILTLHVPQYSDLLECYNNIEIDSVLYSHLKRDTIISTLKEIISKNIKIIAKGMYMLENNITSFGFNEFRFKDNKKFLTRIEPLLECSTTDDINKLASTFGRIVCFLNIPSNKILKHQYQEDNSDMSLLLDCVKFVTCVSSILSQNKLLSGYIVPSLSLFDSEKSLIKFPFKACTAITHRWASPYHSYPPHSDVFSNITLKEKEIGFYVDINAAEIRTIAMLSQDENLNRIFKNNKDPYLYLANKAYPNVSKIILTKVRKRFKTVFFQLLFGSGVSRISSLLGISQEDVERLIKIIFSEFPGVKEYMIRVIEESQVTHGVRTFFGETIPIQEGKENTQAVNYTIQGTSSLIIADGFSNLVRKNYNNDVNVVPRAFIHDCIIGTFNSSHTKEFLNNLDKNFKQYILSEYNMPVEYKLRFIANNFREKIELIPLGNYKFKILGHKGAIRSLHEKTKFKLLSKPVTVFPESKDPLEHSLYKNQSLKINNLFHLSSGCVDEQIACVISFNK